MPMSQEHKDKIAKGVKAYHSCAKSKGCGKPKPKPKPKKKVAKKQVAKPKPKPKMPTLKEIREAEKDLKDAMKGGLGDKKLHSAEKRRITNMKKKREKMKKQTHQDKVNESLGTKIYNLKKGKK